MEFVLLLLVIGSGSLFDRALSQPTVDECIETEQINTESSIDVLPGVVCIQCVLSGSLLGTGAGFLLGNNPFTSDQASVIDGVLVISDTSAIFDPTTRMTVRCFNTANVVFQNQANVALEVYAPPIITGESTVNEGNTLTLDCDSRNSLNNPVVQWIDPQNIVVPNTFQTLTISNINRGQAGTYKCKTVPPSPGISKTSSVEVIVQYAPDVVAERQDLVDVPVGGTLTISCTYESIPPPNTVAWRHNDTTTLVADQRIDITFNATRTTLTITDVTEDEGGSYECRPQNTFGSSTASTQVRIQLPPGPVTGLQVGPGTETTTSLSISWINPEFNGFSEISQFRPRFTSRHDPSEVPFDGDVTTTTRTFSNLSPFTNYTIELFVRNEVQLEGEGVTTNGITLSLVLNVVRNMAVEALSSTSIRVSWEEPFIDSDTTAPVELYRITYYRRNTFDRFISNISAMEYSAILTSLLMGTEYTITVVGVNSAGEGAPVNKLISTNVGSPSVPRDFEGYSPTPFTIIVTWRTPTTDGGRSIVKYVLLFLNGSDTIFMETQSQDLTYSFQHLQQNTSYMMSIRAVNRDVSTGIELESSIVEIMVTTLPVGPPQIPATPTISLTTNVSLTLSWSDPGGYPDNYTVQIKRVVDNWPGIETAGIRDTVHVQNGLTPLTSYEVRVLSININGPSDFSSPSPFRTVGMVKVDGGEGEVKDTLDVTSGETVTLSCSLEQLNSDTSSIDYTWTRQDGSDLPELSSQRDGVLTIERAKEMDSGVYICTANGVEGTFAFTVHELPRGTSDSVSVAAVAVITLLTSLLVFLPVGVVIGVFMSPRLRRCRGRQKQVGEQEVEENSEIYEEPYAIPLSDNEAYVITRNRN